ncbi:MAG: VanW family protein [Candidatus Levybacteria bacterium]|nr:VanW family protein [Candidatus Levybacteria bacterium]
MKPLPRSHYARIVSHILFIVGITLALLLASIPAKATEPEPKLVLASKTISLENRYANEWVSDVFQDNILLTLAYMNGMKKTKTPDWEAVKKPFTYDFTLKPGETFAFHDTAYLPAYEQNVVKTTNAHYSGYEGFKSDGYLMGDGVCHLASLFYWAAMDAKIEATAPVNHDFAAIPEIDKIYGVAIYSDPSNRATSMQQNLYIKNNLDVPIVFRTIYNGTNLTVEVVKEI